MKINYEILDILRDKDNVIYYFNLSIENLIISI
jgi:hypothetical protein